MVYFYRNVLCMLIMVVAVFESAHSTLHSIEGSEESQSSIVEEHDIISQDDLLEKGFTQAEIEQDSPAALEKAADEALRDFVSSATGNLKNGSESIPGLNNKLKAIKKIQKESEKIKCQVLSEIDHHYNKFLPRKNEITMIVGEWPKSQEKEKEIVIKCYPKLVVGELELDFNKTKMWAQNYCNRSEKITYLIALKLLKDIYFNALNKDKRNCLNRIANIVVSFATNNAGCEKSNDAFNKEIKSVLKKERKLTSDIGAISVACATQPYLWEKHSDKLKEEAARKIVESPHNKEYINHLYPKWEKSKEEVVNKLDQNIMENSTKFFNYLTSINNYLKEHERQGASCDARTKIWLGDYLNKDTGLLKHPLVEISEKNPFTAKVLEDLYKNPKRKVELHGTEEYKDFERDQGSRQALESIISRIENIDKYKKEQARSRWHTSIEQARIKARDTIKSNRLERKQKFNSLEKPLLLAKKQQLDAFISAILQVEKVIGVNIDFPVNPEQVNALLSEFEELHEEDKRYWQMNRQYADAVAIPNLMEDLNRGEAITHNQLIEKQENAVTCNCRTCTICSTPRYDCTCHKGLTSRLKSKEDFWKNVRKNKKIRRSLTNYKKIKPTENKEEDNLILLQKKNLSREELKANKKVKSLQGKPLGNKESRSGKSKKWEYDGLDEQNWPCVEPTCSKSFKDRGDRALHVKDTHPMPQTGEKSETFKAIPCQQFYMDFDLLQAHLNALGGGKRGEIPVNSQDKKQSHLHSCMCLACRTVFGQNRELKAHIASTHQKKQDDIMNKIKNMGQETADIMKPVSSKKTEPMTDIEQIREVIEASKKTHDDIFNSIRINPKKVVPKEKRYPKWKAKKV